MTEIEKMFENANAYKMLCNCEFKNLYDYRIEYGSDVCDYTESKIKEPCKVCEKAKQKIKYYPDFTAEKQIELIKWLAIRFNSDYMSYWHNEIKDVWIFRLNDLTELSSEEPCIYEGINKDFTESLCNLINDLWQSLTDQEKEEIRNILNENS